MGIAIRVAAQPGLAAAARAARCPWVAPWDDAIDYPDTHLLDLVCARECARADAVGWTAGPGAGYVFVSSLRPGLARRELMASGELDASVWARRGHTLLAIGGSADGPPSASRERWHGDCAHQ